jgi:Tfp pilus assembly protein PilN
MNRINLLPPAERVKASREQGIAYALLALVAVIVVLGVVYVLEHNKIAAKQSTLDATTAQVDQMNAQIAALQPYEVLQGTASAMSDMAAQIADARIDWASILGELSLVIPDNVQLTSFSANVPASMQAGGLFGGGSASAGTASPDLTITGTAGDSHVTVAEMMVRLGLIPQFMNIQLGSSTEVAGTPPVAPTPTSTSTSSPAPTVAPVVVSSNYQFSLTANLRPFLVAPPYSTASATGAPAGGTGQ